MGQFLPTRLTRQPQQPARIDRSNPLSARLAGSFQLSRDYRDAALSNHGVATGSVRPRATPGGVLTDFSGGGTNYVTIGGSKVYCPTGSAWTIALDFYLDSFDAAFKSLLYLRSDTSTYSYEIFVSNNVSYDGFNFGSPDTFVNCKTSSSTALLGKITRAIITYNGAGASTASNFTVTLNGVTQTATASGLGFGASGKSQRTVISDDVAGQSFNGWIGNVNVFAGAFNGQQIAAYNANPWQLFANPQRRLLVESPAGGVATYSYTATGGFVLSGTAPTVRGITRTATGGTTFSGSAAQSRGAVRSASGGILFAGAATLARGKAYTASGGLTFSGAATVLRGLARTASGGLLFSGAAGVTFHSAIQSLVVTPVGGIVISGTAAVVRTCTRLVSGGIKFAGTSPVEFFSILSTGASDFLGFIRRRGRR